MFRNRYNNFLTILLIVSIVIIIAIVSVLAIKTYKTKKEEEERKAAVITFDENFKEEKNETNNDYSSSNFVFNESEVKVEEQTEESTRTVQYYKTFVVVGTIEIPDINLQLPILETETVDSLETSVAVRYPSNPVLNTKGNIVIAGHNFRDGSLFSNLHLLSVGKKLYIKDLEGKRLSYTIYEVYETTPEDTNYITKNVEDNIEVTLVTCTDDSKARTIICAKAD